MRSIASTTRVALVAGVSMIGLLASTAAWAQVEGPTGTAAAAATTENTGIADIVVTATRSAQSLQSVPVAVSAFTGAALEEQQITNTSKLIQSIPNTTYSKGNFTGSNLTIRGIGATAVSASGDSGVGIHMNDMPLVAPLLFETEFYDIQRIEVLRGPQGTLFGRNATAGVMNIITNKADVSAMHAFGEFEYGNYNSIKVTGMFNMPITDKLAVRVAGVYVNRDGYTTNLWNDEKIDGRNSYSLRGTLHYEPTDALTIDVTGSYQNEDSSRLRSQKQMCVNDPTGVLGCSPAGLGFQQVNANSTAGAILTSKETLASVFGGLSGGLAYGSVYGAASNANSIVPTDVREIYTQYEPTYKNNELILMGNVEYKFEKATLSLIGGYTQNSLDSRQDYFMTVMDVQTTVPTNVATLNTYFPGKASYLFNAANEICLSQGDSTLAGFIGQNYYGCSNRQLQYDISSGKSHQWSGEAHLETSFDGAFNFLIGGNYLNYNASDDFFVVSSGLDYGSLLYGALAGPSATPLALGAPFYDSHVESYTLNAWALFGEAYWQINDELKLTLGARYTSDSKDVVEYQPDPLLAAFVPLGTTDLTSLMTFRTPDVSQSAGTGRILLQWTPTFDWSDSTMFYASYSRGYKSGGINPSFNPAVVADAKVNFGSEHVNAFEIGMKNRALDGTLQANFTGFYYDYQGLQISRIIARSSFNDNTDATVYGLEAEFIFQPIQALQFNANISYLHTSIKDLAIPDSRDPSGGRDDTVIVKDASIAGAGGNCIVAPTTAGNLTGARTLVDAVNTAIPGGFTNAVPVPGTNGSYGAFSYCSVLANSIANPSAGLRALFNTPTGPLPFQYITNLDGSVALASGIDVDLSGNHLQNSPEFKFAVGAQYNFDINASMGGYVRADLNFVGNAYGRIQNSFADRLPAYSTINLQAQLNGGDGKWYVRGFIQNLANSTSVTGMYVTDASSGLFTNIFTLDPRRFGAAVGFNF